MDFDAYAQMAVTLANAPLDDIEALREFFGGHPWWQSRLVERDLIAMRRAQKRFRGVFVSGTGGNDPEAVAELNALLAAYPMQPRISGHDSTNWHMHVAGRGGAVSAEFMAGAVWGLSVWLCEHGSSRFGVCADERCGNVYLDTSSNCCRRFCSERCATRSHVAAHRARKKAQVQATTVDAVR